MNELLPISYEAEKPTVSGRDLHKALEVETPYRKWFPRMCEYGFNENIDYLLGGQKCPTNNPKNPVTEIIDHQLTIPMAKEICMIQRSDKGREFRQYFLKVEENWNSPEAVMSRALQYANNQLETLKTQNVQLTTTVAVQTQQIAELKPKASYYDLVLNCLDAISPTEIAKDYGKSAVWLNNYLHIKKIQFKQGKIWLLYQKYAEQGYTTTKTQTFNGNDGKVHTSIHTYWTQKGRLFIYETLKADGILPLIEREGKRNDTNSAD